jgi:hypothetical protein
MTTHFCYLNRCDYCVKKYSEHNSILFCQYYGVICPVSMVTSSTLPYEVLINNFKEQFRTVVSKLRSFNFQKMQ